jgi:HPt (histidine-containing phosphotransfer) domain-containing protein
MGAQPDDNLLDLSRLENALGGDAMLMGEILEMYESTAAEDIDGLCAAVRQGDAEQIVRRAHALKGSSGNVGADKVMTVASRMERLGREGSIEGAAGLLSELLDTFSSTVLACKAYRAA